MKAISIIMLVYLINSYSRLDARHLTVFFVNQFNNDSIHIYINHKELYRIRLQTNPSTGQTEHILTVKEQDLDKKLRIIEIPSQKVFETDLRKGFNYLYVFKLDSGKYRFDYSNRLLLGE